MLLYYLGAITAFQHLPIVIAVLLFGSSPLIAWLFPLVYEKRIPHGVELLQGVGVLIAITGLLYLTLTKHTTPSVSPKGAWDLLGYAGGITSAVVTVITGKLLSSNRQAKPSPLEISFMSSVFGLLLMPIVFVHSSHAYLLIAQNWETLIGFGVIATLIPGSAFAYACNHLASTITATVSVQLQIWTVILSWLLLGESLTATQIAASVTVMIGAMLCVFFQKSVGSSLKS